MVKVSKLILVETKLMQKITHTKFSAKTIYWAIDERLAISYEAWFQISADSLIYHNIVSDFEVPHTILTL